MAESDKWKKIIIKTFRLSRAHLDLIEQECSSRNTDFSEYVREATIVYAKGAKNRIAA
jgi:hypothetical protein